MHAHTYENTRTHTPLNTKLVEKKGKGGEKIKGGGGQGRKEKKERKRTKRKRGKKGKKEAKERKSWGSGERNNRNREGDGIYSRRCKTSKVGQSAGLLITRSSVRFQQKFQKLRTQIYMDLSYVDPQARVLNCCYK